MASVFLSYDHEDLARAAPIASALEKAGHSVWWDRQIHGGAEYQTEIESAVHQADAVVVLWSGRSIKSAWVRDEAAEGRDQGKLVPVLLESVKPPMGFRQYQTIDLSRGTRASGPRRLDELLRAVTKMSAAAPSTQMSPSLAVSKQGIDRRTVLAGAAVATAAVAGIGGWALLKREPAGASDSIAVLPFANLSGDPSQDYFSDGLAEELRTALSLIAGLKVVARTSSEMLRNTDAKAAARRLSVANVLTGSVRRSPATIRIRAQLIDGANGLERWSQSFDRPIGDVLEIQSDIAQNVARALRVEIGGGDPSALSVGGTSSPEAQDFYLQSLEGRRDDSEASIRRTLAVLDNAIALDPNYAEAHSRRAQVMNFYANVYAPNSAAVHRAQANAAASARTAIRIAPRLASAYAALGTIYSNQLKMGEALQFLRKAEALPGSEVQALTSLAAVLAQAGRQQEALAMARQAASLDPLNHIPIETEAIILYQGRSYQAATQVAQRALKIAPDRVRVKSFLGNCLVMLGRLDEAALVYARLDSGDYRRLVGEAVIAARSGRRGQAQQSLKAIEQNLGDAANYQYAQIAAQLGETGRAIAYLEEAWNKRDPGLAGIRVDPFLDPVRNDPSFVQIAARLRFP